MKVISNLFIVLGCFCLVSGAVLGLWGHEVAGTLYLVVLSCAFAYLAKETREYGDEPADIDEPEAPPRRRARRSVAGRRDRRTGGPRRLLPRVRADPHAVPVRGRRGLIICRARVRPVARPGRWRRDGVRRHRLVHGDRHAARSRRGGEGRPRRASLVSLLYHRSRARGPVALRAFSEAAGRRAPTRSASCSWNRRGSTPSARRCACRSG